MPTSIVLGSDLTVKINGSALAPEKQAQVDVIEVDDALFMPAMCVIRFFDPEYAVMNDSAIAIGKSIEILASEKRLTEDGSEDISLFKGEITSLEPEFNETGFSALTVRGYDKAHRMMATRRTATYLNQTFSDIVSTVAGQSGLSAQSTSTSEQHEYLIQDNQTDFDFVRDLARAMGYIFRVQDSNLVFKKPADVKTAEVEVKLGVDLMEFRPRLVSALQWAEVKVKAWDVSAKQAITGTASSPDAQVFSALTTAGASVRSSAFAQAKWVDVESGALSQGEATSFAQALLDRSANAYAQAEGEIMGNSSVLAGSVLNVTGTGTKFAGKYFITRAIHSFSSAAGYRTRFYADNGYSETTAELIMNGPGGADGSSSFVPNRSLVVGIVTNVKDPKEWGRIKVKLPLLGDNIETGWARLVTPMAGASRGFLYLPEVNDEVLVAFEQGDPNRPYILGAMWNGSDAPPETAANAVGSDGKVNKRIIKTRKGHMLTFDDLDSAPLIELKTAAGHYVKFEDKGGGEKITISDTGNANHIIIDITGKKITIESATEIDIKSQTIKIEGTNVTVKASAQLELTSDGTMKGTGKQIEMNGSGQLALKGGVVQIQ